MEFLIFHDSIASPGLFSSMILSALVIAFGFLYMLWVVYPTDAPQSHPTGSGATASSETDVRAGYGYGYYGLMKHVLLLIFTFGIWQLVWIYRTTAYLNQVCDEPPRIPINKLLLCMFVPFYVIYWFYISAKRLDKLTNSCGAGFDYYPPLSAICLILAIFMGIIPPILMQERINIITVSINGQNTNNGLQDTFEERYYPSI